MKFYLYKKPSNLLGRVLFSPENPSTLYKLFAILIYWPIRLVVIPLVFVLVVIGEIGHGIAGFCGMESRDWL